MPVDLKERASAHQDFPLDTISFIAALDELYPHKCLTANEDITLAHRYGAVREFIDELVSLSSDYVNGDLDD
jgi:hypothetical protein|tara:strand:+ start:358 stop:573 length:216 start_codon:yes stop_codon:yes gene_type:complete